MNGFKVDENKRIWKIVKLMTVEMKKKKTEIVNFEWFVQFTFSFHSQRIGGSIKSSQFGCCSPSFGYISTMLPQSSWKLS